MLTAIISTLLTINHNKYERKQTVSTIKYIAYYSTDVTDSLSKVKRVLLKLIQIFLTLHYASFKVVLLLYFIFRPTLVIISRLESLVKLLCFRFVILILDV
jgi:hypothetical protein